MKKFIKGAIQLDANVVDKVNYEKQHEQAILDIIEWAEMSQVAIRMGTSEDNSYLIEYKIVGKTYKYCSGLLAELKAMLRKEWGKIDVLWEGKGDVLW